MRGLATWIPAGPKTCLVFFPLLSSHSATNTPSIVPNWLGCIHSFMRALVYFHSHKLPLTHARLPRRQLSTEIIMTLSLLGRAKMSFLPSPNKGSAVRNKRGATPNKGGATPNKGGAVGDQGCDVLLPPRSLQLLTGRARYNYTHAISLDNLLDERRVSVTFRQSALTPGRSG